MTDEVITITVLPNKAVLVVHRWNLGRTRGVSILTSTFTKLSSEIIQMFHLHISPSQLFLSSVSHFSHILPIGFLPVPPPVSVSGWVLMVAGQEGNMNYMQAGGVLLGRLLSAQRGWMRRDRKEMRLTAPANLHPSFYPPSHSLPLSPTLPPSYSVSPKVPPLLSESLLQVKCNTTPLKKKCDVAKVNYTGTLIKRTGVFLYYSYFGVNI